MRQIQSPLLKIITTAFLALGLFGCATGSTGDVPPAASASNVPTDYLIGPGDKLDIFVWRNPDLSTSVPVRPDGRISIPLIDDLEAAGSTPTQLGKNIEARLSSFIQDPLVTVIVTGFVGAFGEQIRIVGAGVVPMAIPYQDNMTVLDAIISVGGLTSVAAGNRAKIWRRASKDKDNVFKVRLDDLLKDGDLSANVKLVPGDVIIVPQSWF